VFFSRRRERSEEKEENVLHGHARREDCGKLYRFCLPFDSVPLVKTWRIRRSSNGRVECDTLVTLNSKCSVFVLSSFHSCLLLIVVYAGPYTNHSS
jgi:hypothetical protein